MPVKSIRAQEHKNTRRTTCAIMLFALAPVMVGVCLRPATAISDEPNIVASAGPSEQEIVESACELIYQGRFDAAGELVQKHVQDINDANSPWSRLAQVVQEYEQLSQKRQAQRQASYKEQLAALERIRTGQPEPDTNDANKADDANNVKRPRDPNDPNNVFAVLAVATRACEYADEQQKKDLLAGQYVVESIKKARARAGEFEARGDWIDAYLACYSWLSAMDPNNKSYSDYAERLIEKAEIAGSFQDSPCETSKQRFEGVKKRMFVRAVDALNFNYVSKIDYAEMAKAGVRRCKSLAEVVGTLAAQPAGEVNALSIGRSFEDFSADTNQLSALAAAYGGMLEEIGQSKDILGKDGFLEVFDAVLGLNNVRGGLPEQMVIAHFAEASFGALDPYTVLVWPTQTSEFEKALTNEFTGIGIEIARQKGQLTVASLLPDTPAYTSGLDAGDVIEQVDGKPTKDMPLTCAVKHITGPAGTKVTLTIKREAEERSREITITRAKIVVPTIRGWQRTEEGKWQYMVDEPGKIGYVRITSFSEKTASDLDDVLVQLEKEGMRGLILDLRFNAGGFLESAIEVTDKFVEEGLIVSTRPRFGIPMYAGAQKKGTHPNYPLVVLINAGSASASEIVSGSLADEAHKRAVLVGDRTHGKGVVQGITLYPGDGAQLKYTMAYYHLPSGQRVKSREDAEKENKKDWGIGPNVELTLTSDEMVKMFDMQRDNDVLVKAGHNGVSPLKKHTLDETTAADPQLSVGILVIKTKLIEQTKALKRKAA
jgi:carboxyl-terminal processing protease